MSQARTTDTTRTCPECDGRLNSAGDETCCASCGLVVSEDRIDRDISEDELRQRLDRAEGTLVVCNVCGSMKGVDG